MRTQRPCLVKTESTLLAITGPALPIRKSLEFTVAGMLGKAASFFVQVTSLATPSLFTPSQCGDGPHKTLMNPRGNVRPAVDLVTSPHVPSNARGELFITSTAAEGTHYRSNLGHNV